MNAIASVDEQRRMTINTLLGNDLSGVPSKYARNLRILTVMRGCKPSSWDAACLLTLP